MATKNYSNVRPIIDRIRSYKCPICDYENPDYKFINEHVSSHEEFRNSTENTILSGNFNFTLIILDFSSIINYLLSIFS